MQEVYNRIDQSKGGYRESLQVTSNMGSIWAVYGRLGQSTASSAANVSIGSLGESLGSLR